ncbi:MAG: DUF389 domain-containing protein [Chloroflexi bacterium]|nr:DUF389 domain-containing protein [Chloroflexota bacterium]
MPHSDEPIIPSDPTPPPLRDVNAARGRRRRVTRRDSIPHDSVGQAAFIFDLSRRAYPSFELFVFSLACGAILGLGYLLDSQAVLLLGLLVAPLMTPWVGILLAILTGSPRFLFETFMALFISAFIVFLSGLLTGFAARLIMPMTLTNVYTHSRLSVSTWFPELAVLAIGAVTLVISFARSENKPFLPSVVIAYAFYLPVSAGGFGLGSGLEGIWPQGVLVFVVHFAQAGILGLLTLFILRLRPSVRGIFLSVIALALFVWILFILMGSGFPSGAKREASVTPSVPATQPSALPSLTPSLPATTTSSPRPSSTSTVSLTVSSTAELTIPDTDTPTVTMTLEPAPIFGRVNANAGGGANLRETPGGKLLKTLNNGTIVEVYPEFQVLNSVTWIRVIVTFNGQRIDGWLLETTVTYATPEPNFGTPSITTATPTP